MRVLLISLLQDSHRNLSCLTLYAVASNAGHNVELLFIPNRSTYSEKYLSAFLKERNYDAIGLSVMTCDFHFAKDITTQTISNFLPKSRIIWGGIHPTCMPEESLSVVDCICRGEGEIVFVNWLNALEKDQPVDNLPGLGIRRLDGSIQLNDLCAVIDNLDDIPWNYYDWDNYYLLDSLGVHRFGMPDYTKYLAHNGDGYTTMTSRSCPFHCSYCINSFIKKLSNTKGGIRRRTVDHVIAELKHAVETIPSVRFMNFIDDHFLTSQSWTEEFCEKYKTAIHLPFLVRASPDALTEDNVKMLKKAGLVAVQTGIQSGSEKTHRMIFNRPFDENIIMQVSAITKRHGVLPIYDVIIGNDFEDDEDRDATLKVLLKLQRPYELNIFVLTPFPKTDIMEKYQEMGITPKVDPYAGGYLDYDESDYYYEMASVIPHIPHFMANCFYKCRLKVMKIILNLTYNFIKKRLRNVKQS